MKLIFTLAPAITFISLLIAGTAEAQITSSQQNYPSILFISDITDCSSFVWNTVGGCSSGNDQYPGSSGNDQYPGSSGNDQYPGSSGNDQYPGSSGNDQYSGGSGNDQYSGGSGNDDLTNQGGNSSNNEDSNEKIPNMRGFDGGENDLRY
ncbi:calcium-binding protein [Microcystis aeruginosa]|uniref:calcium-binding protein n=1 Tax=Microcystis aeruginosa TaxID=1126 RepID=UPI000677C7EC|nr:hypothetical protein [Microcystis aeruginosa]